MAKGPSGERRPADVNARAVMITKIATGEVEDVTTDDGKNAAAVALGRMAGTPWLSVRCPAWQRTGDIDIRTLDCHSSCRHVHVPKIGMENFPS